MARTAEDFADALDRWDGPREFETSAKRKSFGRESVDESPKLLAGVPEETGISPARAVERIRIDVAHDWLGRLMHSSAHIALTTGFGSTDRMRNAFVLVGNDASSNSAFLLIASVRRAFPGEGNAGRDYVMALWSFLHGQFEIYQGGLPAIVGDEQFIRYTQTLCDLLRRPGTGQRGE